MEAPGPSTTSTVSASGVEAIESTIEVKPQVQISEVPLEDVYEVDRTVEEIKRGGWTKICLQFPDELLHDSVPVFQAIRAKLPDNVELYVMADTTYGSCCVDEVAAQHVDADFVVHYGHACLSAPARLPVLYIFPKAPIDAEQAASKLAEQIEQESDSLEARSTCLLLCDVAYYHKLSNISEALQGRIPKDKKFVTSSIDTATFLKSPKSDSSNRACPPQAETPSNGAGCCQGTATDPKVEGCCGSSTNGDCANLRQVPLPPPTDDSNTAQQHNACRKYSLPAGSSFAEDVCILYIGPESLTLTNLLLSHSSTPIISYDPTSQSARLESSRTNKLLMKRYGIVQKARDADVFGIVVGTLGVSSYLPTLEYLRTLLKKHKKKSYTMAVGKLTPAKLGNFLEVETWVLVACGENSLVESYKEFMKPIVTPWELEVALGEREWVTGGTGKGQYTLDFASVLHDSRTHEQEVRDRGTQANGHTEDSAEEEDVDAPVFSTVTGKYRYRRTYGGKEDVQDKATLEAKVQALAIRNQDSALSTALSSAGGEFLSTRIYKGLDPRYGQDEASVIEQGRSGIARQYEGDTEASKAGR